MSGREFLISCRLWKSSNSLIREIQETGHFAIALEKCAAAAIIPEPNEAGGRDRSASGAGSERCGAEGDVDAVVAVGVAPGAFVGPLGHTRLTGLDRRVDDGFDLVRREETAGVLRPRGDRDERGCSGDHESRADHLGLRGG